MKKYFFLIYCILCLGIVAGKAQYNVLHTFNNSYGNPYGSLSLSENVLYGMTNDGTIFSINTNGTGYTDLLNLTSVTAYYPYGSLTLSGSMLYGMTYGYGGNMGNIFSLDTNGPGYTDLHNFIGTDGANPYGSLTLSGNVLYGMTYGYTPDNKGTIFSLNTNGARFTDLFDFNGTNGAYPEGSLTLSGNILYGTTTSGGSNGDGVIFSININGSGYTDLFNFTLATGWASPYSSLTLSGNLLYGTTYNGGANSAGCIFSININGTGYTDLFDFSGPGRSGPYGSLTLSGNLLYGMTYYEGSYDDGNIFSIDTNGTGYIDLFNFNGTYGIHPYGSLILSGNVLYGMTENGGGGDGLNGVVFSYNLLSVSATTIANINCKGGNNGSVSAIPSGGTSPYSYNWTPSGGTNIIASNLSAGSYTITITDINGSTATVSTTITQPITAMTITHYSVNATSGCDGIAGVNVSGGTPPYTYYWSAGHTYDTINDLCAGIYTCIITDNNGCSKSTTVTIKNTTGVVNISNSSSINIYPDPNNGAFSITGLTQGQMIELYNYMGQKLNKVIADNAAIHFDISANENGIYLIRIVNKDGSVAMQNKIIKMQ